MTTVRHLRSFVTFQVALILATSSIALAEPIFSVKWVVPTIDRIVRSNEGQAHLGATIVAAVPNDGRLAILADVVGPQGHAVAVVADAAAGFESGFTLGTLSDADRSDELQYAALAALTDGTFWLGGLADARTSVISTPLGDAAFAQVGPNGTVLSAFSAEIARWAPVRALLPQGDHLVAAGSQSGASWIASVQDDGTLSEPQVFGTSKGVALAAMGEDVLVTGILAEGERSDYREHVAVWVLRDGMLGEPVIIRDEINTSRPSNSAILSVASNGERAYVATAWGGPGPGAPAELARIDSDGAVLWRHSVIGPGCDGLALAVAALDDGAALVCADRMSVTVHPFDENGNAATPHRFDTPQCTPGPVGAATLFAASTGPDSVTIAGSIAGCTWLAEISLGTQTR